VLKKAAEWASQVGRGYMRYRLTTYAKVDSVRLEVDETFTRFDIAELPGVSATETPLVKGRGARFEQCRGMPVSVRMTRIEKSGWQKTTVPGEFIILDKPIDLEFFTHYEAPKPFFTSEIRIYLKNLIPKNEIVAILQRVGRS
jgi:hypothetical protein